jgi:hypothetical protein
MYFEKFYRVLVRAKSLSLRSKGGELTVARVRAES